MNSNDMLAKLNVIGEVEVSGSDGEFLCKHEDGMIKRDNSIIAYFMYMPTEEVAISHYFDFLTQPGTSILLRDSIAFNEYKYDGNEFIKVEKS
jgi:hypothetical protein